MRAQLHGIVCHLTAHHPDFKSLEIAQPHCSKLSPCLKVTTSNTKISKTVRAVEKSSGQILHHTPARCTHNICIALRIVLRRYVSSHAARNKTTTSKTEISKTVNAIEKCLRQILNNTPKRTTSLRVQITIKFVFV